MHRIRIRSSTTYESDLGWIEKVQFALFQKLDLGLLPAETKELEHPLLFVKWHCK